MKKIIILNGPPASGKNILAENFIKELPYSVHDMYEIAEGSFALPLKQILQIQYNLTDEEVKEFDSNHVLKNTPLERFGGKSWRQLCIDLSIELKAKFGLEYFGEHLKNRITKTHKNIIVTDGGFAEEIMPLIRQFGGDNIHIVKIIRDGFGYQGDSRRYLDAKLLGARQHILVNEKSSKDEWDQESLDKYLQRGYDLILEILGEESLSKISSQSSR